MCPDEDRILALIDGTLEEPLRADLEAHLDDCEDCRRLVAAALGAKPEHDPTADTVAEGDASARATLTRGATLSRYMILETLGTGGMGIVHLAYDPELDRKVAIKLLWPGDAAHREARQQRVLREAQAMARLKHPNVVTVHDVGTVGDQIFVVMELVEGTTLGKWLAEKRRPWQEIVEVFLKAGRGLAAAHAAGLVHRDFKPDNVLIGKDGRVQVTDFGLARSAGLEEREPVEVERSSRVDQRLTRTGAVVGTPAYMAPEQLDGAVVDARSDLFSFCVALYEGLYGERPFAGDTAREIQRSVVERRVRAEPAQSDAPAWLRSLVTSGLAAEPEKRPESMDALLAVLSRDPSAERRRLLTGGFLTLIVGALALAIILPLRARASICKGSETKLAGVWDSSKKEAVSSALKASGKAWAQATVDGVNEALDRYAHDWVLARTEACEATRVTRVQSEELLDLRVRCLDGRLEEMRALTTVLAKPDEKLLDGAQRAARSLPSLRACSDADALRSAVPQPADLAARAEVDRLRAALGEVRAMRFLGAYKEGERRAGELVEQAKKLGYAPLTADAWLTWSRYLDLTSQFQRSADAARESVREAERGRDRKAAADALSELVWIVGHQQSEPKWAHDYQAHAEAILVGLGGDPETEAQLASNVATLLIDEGRAEEAIAPAKEAAEKRRRVLGDKHPMTAMSFENLAVSLSVANHLEEAVQYNEQALDLYGASVGEHHPLYAHALFNVADTLRQLGRLGEARQRGERAVTLIGETLGKEHAQYASAENVLAMIATAEGKYDEAITLLEDAVKLCEKLRGPEHLFTGHYLSALAEPQARLKQWARARATYERALAIYAKNKETGAAVARDQSGLADVLVGLGEAKASIPLAEAALDWQEKNNEQKKELAATHFTLARALWAAGVDPARAKSSATRALDELGATDARASSEIRAALAANVN